MGKLRDALKAAMAGERLSEAEAEAAVGVIMAGEADPVEAGGLLVALAMRGESLDEVTGAARAMRAASRAFPLEEAGLTGAVDTCGTGGDGSGTFNLSTAASFVAAAAGATVVKHGNRAVSSKSGSADLLEALGATIDLPPEAMAEVGRACGLAFLFAPVYHAAMRHAVPIRRSLGVRTLFNLLGPMCNPAHVRRQVVGVFDARWLSLAEVLGRLGAERAIVVHGAGGLDELSLLGTTQVAEWSQAEGRVRRWEVTPGELGLEPCDLNALKGGDAAANAARLWTLLQGSAEADTPLGQAVALNAGAALWIGDHAPTLRDGVAQARKALRDGRGHATAERFVAETKRQAELLQKN